jgi:hypothetical protein
VQSSDSSTTLPSSGERTIQTQTSWADTMDGYPEDLQLVFLIIEEYNGMMISSR